MTASYFARIVLTGQKGVLVLGNNLSDKQIADAANDVRAHFDNRFKRKAKAADVQGLR